MEINDYNLDEFNYDIPQELIAQDPIVKRSQSRLLVVNRGNSSIKEESFSHITSILKKGDVLVLNNTRVLKARLLGNRDSGPSVEVLLVGEKAKGLWEVLVKPGKRAKVGDRIKFCDGSVWCDILEWTDIGGRIVKFSCDDVYSFIEKHGRAPTPPYIKKDVEDPERYQTVYAKYSGAIAAPTAGLHFTKDLIKEIEAIGVEVVYITLHCGLGTFRPIKSEDIRQHKMFAETVEISEEAANTINKSCDNGGALFAVGTTSVRALESAAINTGGAKFRIAPYSGPTNLYIVPGYTFKVVNCLITNFHTPCSTNLVLVSCFCDKALLKRAYRHAIDKCFHFFSFGDVMVIC